MIRPAIKSDLIRITDIYNQAIKSKKAVAYTEIFTAEQRAQWFTTLSNNERTPIFVYEDETCGIVVGYCQLSEYRAGRQALESVSEISYFLDNNYLHRGLGSALMQHTITAAQNLGYKSLLAIVLDCNDASIALLQKFGFELWGTLPNVAYIDSNVYSHYYYGLKPTTTHPGKEHA